MSRNDDEMEGMMKDFLLTFQRFDAYAAMTGDEVVDAGVVYPYVYTAPSGVKVYSTKEPSDFRWWDAMPLHILWSYYSWFSLYAEQVARWKAPRNFFKKHMERKDYSKS